MTTTRIVPDIGIHSSSGAPTKNNRKPVSTAFLGSTMPPSQLTGIGVVGGDGVNVADFFFFQGCTSSSHSIKP
mgnify:CR=1 FL=1